MAMIYIDKPSMIAMFGEQEILQLTDRDRSQGAVVDVVLDRAMATAESEANSYLGAVYTLPLPSVPEALRSFVGDITRYYLYDEQPTEQVQKRYDRAISWLRDVAKGLVKLGFPTSDVAEPTVVAVASRTQAFSDAVLGKMGPRLWPV